MAVGCAIMNFLLLLLNLPRAANSPPLISRARAVVGPVVDPDGDDFEELGHVGVRAQAGVAADLGDEEVAALLPLVAVLKGRAHPGGIDVLGEDSRDDGAEEVDDGGGAVATLALRGMLVGGLGLLLVGAEVVDDLGILIKELRGVC